MQFNYAVVRLQVNQQTIKTTVLLTTVSIGTHLLTDKCQITPKLVHGSDFTNNIYLYLFIFNGSLNDNPLDVCLRIKTASENIKVICVSHINCTLFQKYFNKCNLRDFI
jgi:hypothetical protein